MDEAVELGLFKAAFESAPDAIIIADENGDIAIANAAAHRILGYELGTLHQLSIDQLVPPDVRDAHAGLRDKFMQTPSPRAMTDRQNIRALRNDGSSFPAHISLSPIRHAGKQWVIAIVRNVSRTRQMEEKLKRVGNLDSLTGLYNRNLFETEVERLSQSRNNIGVILAAMPTLGLANQKYGHMAGDGLLVALASILKSTARGSDIVARVRGDVIALLLPGVPSEDPIRGLVHRIQRKIADHNTHVGEGPALQAIFSFALASPGIELEASLHHAQRELAREARRKTSEFAVVPAPVKREPDKPRNR